MGVRVGVLSLQGDVSEHISAFRRTLVSMGDDTGCVVAVRHAKEIPLLDALAIPGGESTTISRLIDKNSMRNAIERFDGGIFATCAGMVLLAREVDDTRVRPLGLMDMEVARNAFGRQRESFEAIIPVKGLEDPYHAIFIRAPVATATGAAAEPLASIDAGIVAIREGRHMAFSFHPELTPDIRLHRMFLKNLGI
ncbi:MAG: pyridoxal 5'-phosphate synthase glutaminase subunit PdxT [Methanomicrobiaceae archaeon]|nr:pyridoxal 5'-phosphate synthase glutaminase subunit PdxT [Methanomicrobiaceae archaeon]